ncbi:MAG TPA: O-antigen ligase family protein [Fibrobacteria bacterium]|nr:O-antigen ligase family protein [Fibrobacteria bacterium]
MKPPSGIPTSGRDFDRLCFQFLIFCLLASCSVTRLPLKFGYSPKYSAMIYADTPILIVLFLFILLYRALNPGKAHPWRIDTSFLPMALVGIWWLGSGLIMARNPELFWSSIVQFAGGIAAFLLLPGILGAYGLTAFTLDTFLKMSVLVALGSIGQVIVQPARLFENPNSSLGVNHAQLGLYMLFALTVALFRSSRRPGWLCPVSAVLAFIVIFISGSRAAQIGSVPVLVAFFLNRLSFANLVKLGLAGFLMASALWMAVENRKENKAQGNMSFEMGNGVQVDVSSGRRLLMWMVTWKAITSSPRNFIAGFGYTNYRWEYGKSIKLPFYTNAAHNAYIHVWAETGLIGFALFLWMYWAPMRRAFALRKHLPEMTVAAGLVAGVFLTGFTQETMYPNEAFANINVLYAAICATLFLAARLAQEERDALAGEASAEEARSLPGAIPLQG